MQKIIVHPEVGEVTLSQTRRATRISLSVRPNGSVRLSFPPRVSQRRALLFLDEKVEWIALARQKMAEKYPEYALFRQDNQNQNANPNQNTNLNPNANQNANANPNPNPHHQHHQHHQHPLPQQFTQKNTPQQKLAIETLRTEAKEFLPQMVARLAAEHGFRHGSVRVKFTKSRWGSCTVRNDINLSISLAALPRYLAEYVVLHELCHTVHKNHSARFHALLDRVTDGQSSSLNRELRRYRPEGVALMRAYPPGGAI